jgi:hypothetical protein
MKGPDSQRAWKAAEDREWTGMLDQDTFEDVLLDTLPAHTKSHYGWMPHNAGFGFLDMPRPALGRIYF